MASKKLHNVISVHDEDFEVTATEAAKVQNSLVLKANSVLHDADGNVTELVSETQADYEPLTYDGSNETAVSFVSAEGGSYHGPVILPGIDNYKVSDNFKEQQLENFAVNVKDVETLIGTMMGCPFSTWDGESLTVHRIDETKPDSAIQEVNVVLGHEDNISSYISKLADFNIKYSFYICSNEPYNLYFVNDGQSLKLSQHAIYADKLKDSTSEVTPQAYRNMVTTVGGLNTAVGVLNDWKSEIEGEHDRIVDYVIKGFSEIASGTGSGGVTALEYYDNDIIPSKYASNLRNFASKQGTSADFFNVYVCTDEPTGAPAGAIWIKLPSWSNFNIIYNRSKLLCLLT